MTEPGEDKQNDFSNDDKSSKGYKVNQYPNRKQRRAQAKKLGAFRQDAQGRKGWNTIGDRLTNANDNDQTITKQT